MPELPEVETVRCQLRAGCWAWSSLRSARQSLRCYETVRRQEVATGLPGRTIHDCRRLGKFIIVELEGEAFVTLHLGMTGSCWSTPTSPAARPLCVPAVGERRGGVTLQFRDIRKFGRLHFTLGSPAPRWPALDPMRGRATGTLDISGRTAAGSCSPTESVLARPETSVPGSGTSTRMRSFGGPGCLHSDRAAR